MQCGAAQRMPGGSKGQRRGDRFSAAPGSSDATLCVDPSSPYLPLVLIIAPFLITPLVLSIDLVLIKLFSTCYSYIYYLNLGFK